MLGDGDDGVHADRWEVALDFRDAGRESKAGRCISMAAEYKSGLGSQNPATQDFGAPAERRREVRWADRRVRVTARNQPTTSASSLFPSTGNTGGAGLSATQSGGSGGTLQRVSLWTEIYATDEAFAAHLANEKGKGPLAAVVDACDKITCADVSRYGHQRFCP